MLHPSTNKQVSGWWIGIMLLVTPLVLLPFFNEAGWYGIGRSGAIQRAIQVLAFVTGMACSYVGLIRGAKRQRLVCAPIAIGTTLLLV